MIVEITTPLHPCAEECKVLRQYQARPVTFLHVTKLNRRVTPARARDNAAVALEHAEMIERRAGACLSAEQQQAVWTWRRLHDMWLAVAKVLES